MSFFRKIPITNFVGDLETTVEKDTRKQTHTEEWASGICQLYTEDAHIFGSLEDTLNWLLRRANKETTRQHYIIFYHNVKFDSGFWIDWLLKHGFRWGFADAENRVFKELYDLSFNEMSCVISDKGLWYKVSICYGGHIFELIDSLKLLPFELRKIGKDFKTKHQKLEMDYKDTDDHKHYRNCPITKDEMQYLKNDLYVLKEALEFMFDQGHNKLTIGSCAMANYKGFIGKQTWDLLFPNMSHTILDKCYFPQELHFKGITDSEEMQKLYNVDTYLRKSYRGGWVYVKEDRVGEQGKGVTADVNSLYPSVMHSSARNDYYKDHLNWYPIGWPTFWQGNIPDEAYQNNRYFFVRIKCRFRLKQNYLPWIQIKGSPFYSPTECLKDSRRNYYSRERGEWYKNEFDSDEEKQETVTLTLTCLDYDLFKTHYEVLDEEVLDGCYFETVTGIFDDYIDYWAEIKKTSKGAMRQLAKLMLNNLYGKFSTSPDSSYKIPVLNDKGIVTLENVYARDKETVYIPIGSAITSYAKRFTIQAAQKNFERFCYADTDSIHCIGTADELIDVPVHPTEFNHWKIEATWDKAYFVRQKTYIEHVVEEDLVPINDPYYNIKCAGMPEHCKELFAAGLTGTDFDEKAKEKLTEDEKKFLYDKDGNLKPRTLDDFNVGLCIPGKLMPRRVDGGIVLTETEFTMH